MRKVAIDFSSFAWRALLAGTDRDGSKKISHEGKVVTVNSAEHGYENITNMLVALLKQLDLQPIDTILVFEGLSSKSRRLYIDKSYKANRESRPPEAYEQFTILSKRIASVWRGLGATAMTQDHAEGDDTLAWLAQEYPHELIIATYDGDLTALNTEDGEANAYGGTCQVWIDGVLGVNKFGGFPYNRVRIYKALVGDTSDGIKGVAGFGPAAFFSLVELIGWDGIDELEGLLEAGGLSALEDLVDDTKTGKLVAKIVASADSVCRAWQLVKLRPEWVNTMVKPLQIVAGKVSDAPEHADSRLAHWYCDNHLITADNYDDAVETVRVLGAQSPFIAFDIETSTSDESDDWLATCNDPDGVDTLGSVLTGFSLTFGRNMQTTVYVSVDHANTNNVTMVQARKFLEVVWALGKATVIHNTFFELPVLYLAQDEDGTLWREHWKDNGYRGFVPRALDTKLESSYVDENQRLGLKLRSELHLDYKQETFEDVTTLRSALQNLPPGGKLLFSETQTVPDPLGFERPVTFAVKKYKMRALSARHVRDYALDDTICTAALHTYFFLVQSLEHTWNCYLDTEIDAAYLHAKSFVDGIVVSIQKSRELEKLDDVTFDAAWSTVRAYLISLGWAGTTLPAYTPQITVKEIKHAYAIVTGQLPTDIQKVAFAEEEEEGTDAVPVEDILESKDPVLATKMRTVSKFSALLHQYSHETFATMLERLLNGDVHHFTEYVRGYFKGDPEFKVSNKTMVKLLYTDLKCPIKVRGKATDIMRSKGIYEGNPKGDVLALEYALRDMVEDEKVCKVLHCLKLMQMVRTRRSLYYSKYPNFVHWKTGRIHVSHNQCATNTRRASESKPNKQQLPKHPKIEGQPARYREVIRPHCVDAVVVSMDFSAQELRVIADYSQDNNMLACYVGDSKKDMHSFIGVGIVRTRHVEFKDWTYQTFMEHLKNPNSEHYQFCKEMRALGKKVGFTTEYGAMAPKLAATLLCTESEAQEYIEAKEEAFPTAKAWKKSVIVSATKGGFVKTKAGAVRHLQAALKSEDKWVRLKAERQAVNYKIQSSSAEMTKQAEGRMWKTGLYAKYNAVYYGPVHDECVASCAIQDLPDFLADMHSCMVGGYADMEVPIVSEISFGPSFGQQIEIGDTPDSVKVKEALKLLTL